MQISEIFRSIQGESTRAGLPCIFVRLTGCNLRCTWCDTAYAFHGGTKMTVDEIWDRVEELSSAGRGDPIGRGGSSRGVSLVELTGGEPLLQPEVIPLAQKLLHSGYTVMIETSGERPVAGLPREVIKIVDVKTQRHDLARRVHQVLFSPVHADPEGTWPGMSARELTEWILADGLPVRLGLQLHKFIWHPAARGV